ncbi:polysaccharide deacetylase family protein [Paenibacillus sp. J5C_2022]|uniref:polysaccharide deacetylase family protein n=1 Tax=Paenibacillus sp. J5C2022 TaxID=2977129 RepID=UPI0021D33F6F|nr:polysaccharide deacetylase family protein [Paenibacillus sp. J5C2022]MCU6710043.1 polysaccharide deacetylase family protein [Paenibacillus sp. J5C2022]
MRKRNWYLVPLLAFLLAGCSGGAGEQAAEPAVQPDSVTAAPEASASGSADVDLTPESSLKPAETAAAIEAVPDVAPEPSAEPVKAMYSMNKVFRFVPIEEDAPERAVLLTFDDGPKDETVLTSMLDTLDKHGAKAIFFVNGYRVKQNPDLLKLIHERGQTIGNHSYDHINLKNEDADNVESQLGKVQEDVEALIGERPKFFRPPFGAGSDIVRDTAKNHGMLYMTWSNGSLDWDKTAKGKPEVVVANVMEQLHPGANILMHELEWTAEALDELLTKIAGESYVFIDPASIDVSLDD